MPKKKKPAKRIQTLKRKTVTIVKRLNTSPVREKTPTVFVPLTPERFVFDDTGADLLYGLFHFAWRDMPSPRTYVVRLADAIGRDGKYKGSFLMCSSEAIEIS